MLVATSGDTGGAVMNAFSRHSGEQNMWLVNNFTTLLLCFHCFEWICTDAHADGFVVVVFELTYDCSFIRCNSSQTSKEKFICIV